MMPANSHCSNGNTAAMMSTMSNVDLLTFSFIFLNSAVYFHGRAPVETFQEAGLIICVCVEAVSIKKCAEINVGTFWVIEK